MTDSIYKKSLNARMEVCINKTCINKNYMSSNVQKFSTYIISYMTFVSLEISFFFLFI